MSKKELCEAAQPYANESMTYTKPGATQFYNGWSASSTLVKKELIEMWSNPKKIKLTDAGRDIAKLIMEKRSEAEQKFSFLHRAEENLSVARPNLERFLVNVQDWKILPRHVGPKLPKYSTMKNFILGIESHQKF